MTKKHNFEAETGRILELLTHSIYSNKEIFLRELVSNSSDAIDKARIKSLTDTTFLKQGEQFQIDLSVDKDKKTITLKDNGIWMTEEELHSNLWTIAKSGTKEFLDKLKKAKEDGDHNLIGQFWVGFYSSFMVADSVEVTTKSWLDKKSHTWKSDGKSDYEVIEADKKERGTEIVLHINEANTELLEDWKIRELIKKYSNYVWVPIMMLEVENDENKGKRKLKQVNDSKAIWKKSKSEITDEELKSFYQSVSMDFNEPLTYLHTNVEGMVSYKSILFVPQKANMFKNLSDPNIEYGPKLYIQNVLILENAKELLPVWLRFVSWVVETSDLPLNISREMLQWNTSLEKIKKWLTKKVVAELKKSLRKDETKYDEFLESYGNYLKEGIHYEADLKENIAEVLKFQSYLESKSILLDSYLENSPLPQGRGVGGEGSQEKGTEGWGIKESETVTGDSESSSEWQENSWKTIYYITAKSKAEALASPYLNQFQENNVDVLLLTDPIDEWLVQTLTEYKWASLKSIMSDDIELSETSEEEKEKEEKQEKDFKDFLELSKNIIGSEKIEKVVLNKNLWKALGALKTPEGWMNPQMEKMMKSMGQTIPPQKRILELNPNNTLLKAMKKEFQADVKSKSLKDLIMYSYYQAILLEWGELENIWDFVELTQKFAKKFV
jgi:molecular chaperone HtpG